MVARTAHLPGELRVEVTGWVIRNRRQMNNGLDAVKRDAVDFAHISLNHTEFGAFG